MWLFEGSNFDASRIVNFHIHPILLLHLSPNSKKMLSTESEMNVQKFSIRQLVQMHIPAYRYRSWLMSYMTKEMMVGRKRKVETRSQIKVRLNVFWVLSDDVHFESWILTTPFFQASPAISFGTISLQWDKVFIYIPLVGGLIVGWKRSARAIG